MAEHRCGTCKHFEAAPMWKKGWCRNPLLYAPTQSHLVAEEDLDCNRGMGSYWEPLESELPEQEPATTRFTAPPPRTIAPAHPGGGATTSGPAATPRRDRAAAPPTPVGRPRPQAQPRPRRAVPLPSSSAEGYAAPPDERAWGDYLRLSFPVIGVILLLGVLWVWSSALLARRGEPGQNAPLATVQPGLGQVPSVIVPSPTAPPAGAPAPGGAPAAGSAPPAPLPGVIAPGAKVVVSSPGDGANIRQNPTLGAPAGTAVNNGTILTISGVSKDADGYTWWPVQGDGFSGWVAGALIEPAP